MNACRAPASILQSGKSRRKAYPISAQDALATSELALLLDDDVNAADWLHMSVCKNKCLLLCTLAALNECVSASTRRETSHIDRPLRLAARGSRTATPCSAVSASSAVRILLSARIHLADMERTRYPVRPPFFFCFPLSLFTERAYRSSLYGSARYHHFSKVIS